MTQELLTMTPKELSRYEVIKKLINKEINGTVAAKQMRLTKRQVRNIKAKVKELGAKGIIHGLRGKKGNKNLPEEKTEEIKKIVEGKYHDFGPTFAAEKLLEMHQIEISSEKLRLLMSVDNQAKEE